MVDTSDEWITSRTGIKERRICDNGIQASDMATEACRNALLMAGQAGDGIDMLVLATVTPDYRLPSQACIVQRKLGLPNAVAFDVVSACTGFINGLSIARSYIETDQANNVLVCGVERLSSIVNWEDRATCVLFGDGAGAAVVTKDDSERGVLSTFMRSDGNHAFLLWQEVGGSAKPYTPTNANNGRDKILMNGTDVFKIAVREMAQASERAIADAGLTAADIALIVPHQANIRIIEALAKRLNISMDRVYLNIEKYGNTSAASVPIALDEVNRGGRLNEGDHILMVAFGGGLIWGSAVVRW